MARTRLVLDRCADVAAQVGEDRRRFLTRAGAVAATLTALNACSSTDMEGAASSTTTTRSTTGTTTTTTRSTTRTTTTLPSTTITAEPGGAFDVPDPADEEACAVALGGSEFIFDVHTHHVVPDGPWRELAPAIADMVSDLATRACAGDRFVCLDQAHYVREIFLASDTTIALLSDVPNGGDADAPMPYVDKLSTADLVDTLTGAGGPRVLVHDVVAPNFGDLAANLDLMQERAASGRVAAVKVYTAWGPGGVGWSLLDPTVGRPFVDALLDTDVRVLCGHKGLPIRGFDPAHNSPDDLVAVAAEHPELQVVVYHSGYEREFTEGPYDPNGSGRGVDTLLRALDRYGVAPNANVWCELGTTWREVMADPNQAAHVMGKLLSRVGQHRVLWGTDAIWYGSPQAQIMAFRAFSITEQFQAEHGYPALTDEVKAKVFGLNAAQLFGVDVEALRCGIGLPNLTDVRSEHRALVDEGALSSPYRPLGPLTRREVITALRHRPDLLDVVPVPSA